MSPRVNDAKQTLARVRKTISRFRMIQPNDRVIVAVSGGRDSVCLLHVLHCLRDFFPVRLVVAHYEHGLRPMEDAAETDFVQQFAASLGLPFESEKGALSIGREASIEERARDARYAFFEKVRLKHEAQKIALGHHLNDQAETILMRLLRGSGPSGLTGIPPCRDGTIIRPLLEIDRLQIDRYLEARQLAYVTDTSNLRATYLRNKIRLQLMPLLENYQPQVVRLLGQTAKILREEDAYLEKIVEAWLTGRIETKPGVSFRISISSLLELPIALRRRVTRQLIGKVKKDLRRISWDHIESVQELVNAEKPQSSLGLPGGIQIKRTYDQLVFSAETKGKLRPFSFLLDGPGKYSFEEIGRTISVEEMPNRRDLDFGHSPWTAFLDLEKLRYPLTLRSLRPGDRFVPLGMTGHKKLKDFFVDLKIPRDQRYSTPILCCDNSLIWVCGFRIDDRFKVTPETKRVMRVTLDPALQI